PPLNPVLSAIPPAARRPALHKGPTLLTRTRNKRPPQSIYAALRPPPSSTLFPYTTLFRSKCRNTRQGQQGQACCCNGVALHDIPDRKSTRLNSSHVKSSYAGFCLKKKKRSPQKRPNWRARGEPYRKNRHPPAQQREDKTPA